jgi:hypothetical protein
MRGCQLDQPCALGPELLSAFGKRCKRLVCIGTQASTGFDVAPQPGCTLFKQGQDRSQHDARMNKVARRSRLHEGKGWRASRHHLQCSQEPDRRLLSRGKPRAPVGTQFFNETDARLSQSDIRFGGLYTGSHCS